MYIQTQWVGSGGLDSSKKLLGDAGIVVCGALLWGGSKDLGGLNEFQFIKLSQGSWLFSEWKLSARLLKTNDVNEYLRGIMVPLS